MYKLLASEVLKDVIYTFKDRDNLALVVAFIAMSLYTPMIASIGFVIGVLIHSARVLFELRNEED